MRVQRAKAALELCRQHPPGRFLAFGLARFLSPENDYAAVGTTRKEIAEFLRESIRVWVAEGTIKYRLDEIRSASRLGYTPEELGLAQEAEDEALVTSGIQDDADVSYMLQPTADPVQRYDALHRVAAQLGQGDTSLSELGLGSGALQSAYEDIMTRIADLVRNSNMDASVILSRETDHMKVNPVEGVKPVDAAMLGISRDEFTNLAAKAEQAAELMADLIENLPE